MTRMVPLLLLAAGFKGASTREEKVGRQECSFRGLGSEGRKCSGSKCWGIVGLGFRNMFKKFWFMAGFSQIFLLKIRVCMTMFTGP